MRVKKGGGGRRSGPIPEEGKNAERQGRLLQNAAPWPSSGRSFPPAQEKTERTLQLATGNQENLSKPANGMKKKAPPGFHPPDESHNDQLANPLPDPRVHRGRGI